MFLDNDISRRTDQQCNKNGHVNLTQTLGEFFFVGDQTLLTFQWPGRVEKKIKCLQWFSE
jgi:hypothetical protein